MNIDVSIALCRALPSTNSTLTAVWLHLSRCHHLEVREQGRQYDSGVSDCSVGRDLSMTSVGRTLDIRLSSLESLSGEVLFRVVSRGEMTRSISSCQAVIVFVGHCVCHFKCTVHVVYILAASFLSVK